MAVFSNLVILAIFVCATAVPIKEANDFKGESLDEIKTRLKKYRDSAQYKINRKEWEYIKTPPKFLDDILLPPTDKQITPPEDVEIITIDFQPTSETPRYVDSSEFRTKNVSSSDADKTEIVLPPSAELAAPDNSPAQSWQETLLTDRLIKQHSLPPIEGDKNERFTHSALYGFGLGF